VTESEQHELLEYLRQLLATSRLLIAWMKTLEEEVETIKVILEKELQA
jgi:hypothetical protein